MIVYVLELENNKIYIGTTEDLSSVIQEHATKKYCQWTKCEILVLRFVLLRFE